MSTDSSRSIELQRTAPGNYTATNARGGSIPVGSGSDDTFTPVELLLTAIAACSAVDVDLITSRRAAPTEFGATASGNKINDSVDGNRMVDLVLDFAITFADDEAGRQARAVLPRAIQQSHDRLCTVGRTVEAGSPISSRLHGEPVE